MTPEQSIVIRFIDRINAHDLEGLLSELSEDHEFRDSLGESLHGREALRRAWQQYFQVMPDYLIEVVETLQDGTVVALFGWASATYAPKGKRKSENRWRVPAAWRAVVRRGRIAAWQVYADNQPVSEIINREGAP